jgi:hypothetical protein
VTIVADRLADVERGYAVEVQGLRILAADLSREQWIAIGAELAKRDRDAVWTQSALAFALGDWLVYGQGRGEWGHYYTDAMAATGLAYDTLERRAAVALAYAPEERVHGATWRMHRESLALAPDKRLPFLRAAVEERWTWHQFVERVKAQTLETPATTRPRVRDRPRAKTVPRDAEPARHEQRRLRCPQCGHEWEPDAGDWVRPSGEGNR